MPILRKCARISRTLSVLLSLGVRVHIVQTTTDLARMRQGEVAKVVAGKKIPRPERAVPVQVPPPRPDHHGEIEAALC